MSTSSFFDESREQSLVKTEIVAKYFSAWAKVIKSHAKQKKSKIAYIDLFCGPGRYKDGSKSTPLIILEKAIADPDLREMLITIFNDKDFNNTQSLQQEITSLPNINRLKNTPVVLNIEIGEEIVKKFQETRFAPTLFFIDPWGYKGLSLALINSLIMNWGCDCIFFFNYNRVNMGLNNKLVQENMDCLFGKERADILRQEIEGMQPYERELTIIENICQALKQIGGNYPLPFRFKNAEGNRTSHHLIFVSKNVLGYSIMKDIMAKESSSTEQNVPSFEYNPATQYQPLLFDLSTPLDALENMLLEQFAGRTLTRVEVFNQHHIGKSYIEKNYREVLLRLESEGKIIVDPPVNKRRKNTLGENVKITFPPKP